jgi:hypothetical protein
MPVPPPSARYMILCDDVLRDEQQPKKLTIVGLTTQIDWAAARSKSRPLPKLVVLLVLTDGHGAGYGKIVCVNEETGDSAFWTDELPISFVGKDPTGHFGVKFTKRDIVFQKTGTYLVQFLFNDQVVQEQVLLVR